MIYLKILMVLVITSFALQNSVIAQSQDSLPCQCDVGAPNVSSNVKDKTVLSYDLSRRVYLPPGSINDDVFEVPVPQLIHTEKIFDDTNVSILMSGYNHNTAKCFLVANEGFDAKISCFNIVERNGIKIINVIVEVNEKGNGVNGYVDVANVDSNFAFTIAQYDRLDVNFCITMNGNIRKGGDDKICRIVAL